MTILAWSYVLCYFLLPVLVLFYIASLASLPNKYNRVLLYIIFWLYFIIIVLYIYFYIAGIV